jgi:hypothetical protein
MNVDQNHPTIKPGIQINRTKRPRRPGLLIFDDFMLVPLENGLKKAV